MGGSLSPLMSLRSGAPGTHLFFVEIAVCGLGNGCLGVHDGGPPRVQRPSQGTDPSPQTTEWQHVTGAGSL